MAGKKLPNWVHCAKCGYRGVHQAHDCTQVRAATAAVVEQAAKRTPLQQLADSADAPPPMSLPTRTLQLACEHTRLLGRYVTYRGVEEPRRSGPADDTGPTTLDIQQRCRACGSDVIKRVHLNISAPLGGIELCAAARKAYLLHRCPPADSALLGFTYEEINELHESLDLELNRIGEYLAQVDAVRKAQPR